MLKYGGDVDLPSAAAEMIAVGLKPCASDTTLAVIWPFGNEPPCSCDRIYETVGKQDVRATHSKKESRTKGSWYSTPKNGECKPGQILGETCSWRLLEVSKAISASCLYSMTNKAVESHNPECFNSNSDYMECFDKTADALSETEAGIDLLTQPWYDAFNGGCPDLTHTLHSF